MLVQQLEKGERLLVEKGPAVHLLLQPPLLDSLDDAVDDAGDMEEKTENDENWANYP